MNDINKLLDDDFIVIATQSGIDWQSWTTWSDMHTGIGMRHFAKFEKQLDDKHIFSIIFEIFSTMDNEKIVNTMLDIQKKFDDAAEIRIDISRLP